MKLRRDDLVVVISGNFRGQGPAKVLSIDSVKYAANIEGIGSALRHVKRGHPKSPQGGRVALPVPIHLSNLALHCANCGRGVRVKYEFVDNSKRRVCGRCRHSV